MRGSRPSAATRCISLVPGLCKQVVTPQLANVLMSASAPFMRRVSRPIVGQVVAGLFFGWPAVPGSESAGVATLLFEEAQVSVVQDRAIVVAALISLLVHAPLLLPIGPSRVGPPTAPVLEVRIEPLEGRRALHDSTQDEPLAVVEPFVAPQPGEVPESEEPVTARAVPEPGKVVLESVDRVAANAEALLESAA